jgi:hypothetical protein
MEDGKSRTANMRGDCLYLKAEASKMTLTGIWTALDALLD